MNGIRRLVFAALMTTACAGGAAPDQPAPATAAATLVVENLGFADVTVYAVTGTGNRVRLGQVNGNTNSRLELPGFLVRGGQQLQFFADPIGGGRGPVTEELFVAPGETVTMTIPPH